MVLEMWSARRTEQIAKTVAENRVQRRKEYERAISLLGKGQHPESSVFKGRPTPISDEEWDQWHQNHGNLFLSARVVKFLSLPPLLLRAHASASRITEQTNRQTDKQTNKPTNKQTAC